MLNPEQAQRYLTKLEVATRLSCGLSTVERLIQQGRIETTRLPGTTLRRISEQALDEYLNPVESGTVHQLRERRA